MLTISCFWYMWIVLILRVVKGVWEGCERPPCNEGRAFCLFTDNDLIDASKYNRLIDNNSSHHPANQAVFQVLKRDVHQADHQPYRLFVVAINRPICCQ